MGTFWDSSIRLDVLLSETIGEMTMPPLIEIKGLGLAVASAKKGIADLRVETAGLSTDASALVSAIQDVRTQIKQAHEDLKFEAETLGNGAPTDEPEKPSPPPVTPEVAKEPSTTFPAA